MASTDGQNLIARYKRNYAIPADADVTEEMIRRHWELEQRLTAELLRSSPEERWNVFARCYDTLYRELEWLNRLTETASPSSASEWHRVWRQIIGAPPQRIFEVGSGRGELISYLAANGYDCTASEITRERGETFAPTRENLSWKLTDGVHLDRFEAPGSYDVVVSNSLIEHLHPDDLLAHFTGAFSILKNGGRYIFCTPHRASGPSDISIVFGREEPKGMHLREYTYGELADAASAAGYRSADAVLIPPSSVGRAVGRELRPFSSHSYLAFFRGLERLMLILPNQRLRRKAAGLARLVLFKPCIFMVAHKGGNAT
jgi:2-polyprenyl-3-methyl-5-hydroxy-6-metoxy-1,4-benzoquinol methylase